MLLSALAKQINDLLLEHGDAQVCACVSFHVLSSATFAVTWHENEKVYDLEWIGTNGLLIQITS